MSARASMPPRRPRTRPPRVLVAGASAFAVACATRLEGAARITMVMTDAAAERDALLCGTSIRHRRPSDAIVPHDAAVIGDPGTDSGARDFDAVDFARRLLHACPDTVLILALPRGLAAAATLARRLGCPSESLLATAGLPLVLRERRRLAARHGLCSSQIDVVALGGEVAQECRVISRYTRAAGIPPGELGAPAVRRAATVAPHPFGLAARVEAAVMIARAVAQDRRAVLCCGARIGHAYGIPGGWCTAPVRVGGAGAEDPIPISLTVEERSFLVSVAVLDAEAPAWLSASSESALFRD